MPIEMSELYKYIGRTGRFDGDPCMIGYKLKSPTEESRRRVLYRVKKFFAGLIGYYMPEYNPPEIFWGGPVDPKNVVGYVAAIGRRKFVLTPENIGKLKIE